MGFIRFISVILLVFFFSSCINRNPVQSNNSENGNDTVYQSVFLSNLSMVLTNAELPYHISASIKENISSNPSFILDLFSILQSDPYLWILVDKQRPLPEDYEPQDLVELTNRSFRINRAGLLLRNIAAESLEEMAAAARSDGLTLLASSAYRSFSNQAQIYERNVRLMGQEAADRESARPGHSQHQLGLVVDFGSITDAFADTAEGRWLAANASRFGWSLSYPDGYEEITGYRWESWHYRYVGVELAEFIDTYFEGIQQFALRFIYEWQKAAEYF
jgi:D-alanyl-D-alanine carboxypeptidase